jgi:hypothetical protein
MYKQYIKEWLLAKQARVYSVIVSSYREKLNDLKPSLFRKWLAKELDIPEAHINLSSLNSALTRYKKKEAGNNKTLKQNLQNISYANNEKQHEDFTFSSGEANANNSRTTEL